MHQRANRLDLNFGIDRCSGLWFHKLDGVEATMDQTRVRYEPYRGHEALLEQLGDAVLALTAFAVSMLLVANAYR